MGITWAVVIKLWLLINTLNYGWIRNNWNFAQKHFHINFLEWKHFYIVQNIIEMCSQLSKLTIGKISSDKCLLPSGNMLLPGAMLTKPMMAYSLIGGYLNLSWPCINETSTIIFNKIGSKCRCLHLMPLISKHTDWCHTFASVNYTIIG